MSVLTCSPNVPLVVWLVVASSHTASATAAAVGARVVRFEAWLPAEASEELIRQVETVAASLTAPAPADSAQIERELQMLRSGSIPGLPLSILPPSLLESGTPATSSPQLQPDLLDSGSSNPAQSGAAGEVDQTTMGETDDALAAAEDAAGASVRIATDGGRDSEISIAISGNGRNVVIGTNNNWHY